jgi:hypothetical protein
MAHIKLANPRRSLHSQVLLSNFMYSYLAIVQAMHPQMNVPISPQQKRLEEEARRQREEQEHLAQRDAQDEQDEHQSLDQYDFDYHRVGLPWVINEKHTKLARWRYNTQMPIPTDRWSMWMMLKYMKMITRVITRIVTVMMMQAVTARK